MRGAACRSLSGLLNKSLARWTVRDGQCPLLPAREPGVAASFLGTRRGREVRLGCLEGDLSPETGNQRGKTRQDGR